MPARKIDAQKMKKRKPATEAATEKKDMKEKKATSTPSTFQEEEPDFPRGGSSSLTPSEVKEARAQAEAEFESESKKGRKKQKTNAFGDDLENIFMGELPKSVGLFRYKSLSVGMKVLGVILEIGNKDLVVSLPGGLRGFVNAEDVSDYISSNDSVEEEDEEEKKTSLNELFVEGQLVSCVVISLENSKGKESKKKSKRIGLTLRLSCLHSGLTIDAMHEGLVIQSIVTSIEDHGYLLSFGVPGITGFLLLSDGADLKQGLRKGQIVQGVIHSVDKKRGMVMVKADADLVSSSVTKEVEGLTMELLVPGILVNARVRAVLKDGLLLSFLTYFTGTVNLFHLETSLPQSDWQKHYSQNQRLKARVLYVDNATKSIGLTLNNQLIQNKSPKINVDIGDVFEDALVQRVDATIGLLLELPVKESSVAGYVHISDVSDGHVDKLQEKFKVGKIVKGRVIGKRLMDGLAVVTLKESKVKQHLFSCMDVKPGMPVTGEISRVEPFGAIVKLSDGLNALCPLQHMSEFNRTKPSSKFKVGAKMKFKVLSVDTTKKAITVTHKKTMLSSKLKPLVNYEDAIEGLVTHGWIAAIEEYGCFVVFYNNVKGLVHRTELGLGPGLKPDSAFQVGQVVKCRVMRVDPAAQRLSLSFVLSPDMDNVNKGDIQNSIAVGDEVSGVVVNVSDTTITFDVPLSHGVVMAFMKVEQLSDSPGHVEQLKSVLFPGCKIDRLLVLERDEHRIVVTSKFSFMSAKAIPSDISQLNAQDVIPGYIASITDVGCFVHFLGGLTGLAVKSQLSGAYVHNPSEVFYVGQSVRAQVLGVNLETRRFTLSLKQSFCYSTDVTLLQGYFLEEEKIYELQAKKSDSTDLDWGEGLEIGKCVEGEIQDVKDYGIIVNLLEHKDIVGFLTHHQVNSKVEVGDRVTARILDVVKSDGIVDLTLLPSHIESASEIKSKKSARKRAHVGFHVQQKVWAVVELIKDEYLVLSLPDYNNAIGFASAHDYNFRVDPHQKYSLHQRLEVMVGALPETSGVGRLLLLLTSFSDPASTSGAKRAKRTPGQARQQFVNGEVISIESFEMLVRIGADFIGRVHVTQVTDSFPSENPLNHYKVGQKIKAKMVGKIKYGGDKNKYVDLTLRPSQLGLGHHGNQSRDETLVQLSSLKLGEIVTAYVKEVHDEWAWLVVAPGVTGRLFVLYSSAEPAELICFKDRFNVGQPVKCKVRRIDSEKKQLDLTQRGNLEQTETLEEDQVKINDILGGRIYKILPGVEGVLVQIGAHQYGRVHITHLSDVWKDNPTEHFQVGQFVKCVVLDIKQESNEKTQVDLSLRESIIVAAAGEKGNMNKNNSMRETKSGLLVIQKIEDIEVGMEVQGFVKSLKKGCFVTLSRHVDARILISNLSDSYIRDVEKSFPVGKLVKGWIISVDIETGFVEMTLKDPTKEPVRRPKSVDFSGVHVGDVVSGVVTRVEKYGVFINISNTDIVGLCHISQIPTDYIKDLERIFKVDDRVQAKILKVDEEKKRVTLGMKETYFKDPDSNVASSDDDRSISENDSDRVSDAEDSDEEITYINLKKEINDATTLSLPPMPEVPQIIENVKPLGVVLQTEETGSLAESKVDEISNLECQQKLSKREKRRQKEARESAIRAAEQKRLEGDDAPETAEDFEKLVHASPNSSFIWIKYMAFLLSQGDVDKARQIAERALHTINFREEGEKLNVWVALLNLENAYGNPAKEATLAVFQKALQYCDPKKLYIALLGIYDRAEQHDMADELLKTMTQKFKTSSKIWLRRIQYLLKQGLSDAAHKTLDRSLLSLPQRKHIKLISQVAITEFKIGSPERARSLLEGILRNYPKRADLWSVYLDQEIGLGDQQVTRALFERAISLDLPPKKMKFLFKKYLDYEKSHGSEERVEYVKAKAMQYVESKVS